MPPPEPIAQLTVDADDDGQRLDKVVMRRWKLPPALVQKAIRRGWIRVNGDKVAASARVAQGDDLQLADASGIEVTSREKAPAAEVAPTTSVPTVDARVVFRDPDVAVFDKPAGIPTHGGTGHATSFQDAARAELLRLDGPDAVDPDEPGSFVHRLDRDASGLLLYGRNAYACRKLSETIRDGKLEREYLVLVAGKMSKKSGEIKEGLRKAKGGGKREKMVVGGPGAKASLTLWRVEKELDDATLLAVKLGSGRTHQIRAHMESIRHPLLGDFKYGIPRKNADARMAWGLKRLFLHAREIAFPHPRTGARFSFRSPLPEELQLVIERAGGKKRRRR